MANETTKVRGTAIYYDDESMEFVPQKEGKAIQKNVKKYRKSRYYQTDGEKTNSFVCHLVADGNDPDPFATMYEDMERMAKDVTSKPLAKKRGKVLYNSDGIYIVLSATGNMQVSIDVPAEDIPTIQASMVKRLYTITQCFVSNQTSLQKYYDATKKRSQK